MTMQNAPYKTFKLLESRKIPALKVEASLYEHVKTGAVHLHLASENTENVFMVAFRTMPESSNGVAHILEHTALCGSEKYPTRDPFFSMIRRSLNSFMNAFTSCDWTAYPFASPNKKDFNNLLGVYLDAAFFPRLDELDFLQEGHRLDFEKEGDASSNLVFKGVVFNEMKGAMSEASRVVHQEMQTQLCPGTTYEVNSGGEPVNIPDLTYEEFKHFHAEHYHPSNATFMTFGDISAATHQEKFETLVLHRFDRLNKTFSVPNVKRFSAPKTEHIRYAFDEEDTTKRTYIQMGWLLGETTNVYEGMKNRLLYDALLGDSSAPLMTALESSPFGKAPLCYMDSDNKETQFLIGLSGSEVKHTKEVEKLILSTLEKVEKEGLPKERTEALLDQMEIDIRNLETGSYPLGLAMMLGVINYAIHHGNVLEALDLNPALERLRKEALSDGFINSLVRENLLENNHRVTLVAEPDTTLSTQKIEAEAARLAKIKAGLKDSEKEEIIAKAKALDARQSKADDVSCLPTVTMEDIPTTVKFPTPKLADVKGLKAHLYPAATNGLVAEGVVMTLPNLTEKQQQLLPIYTAVVTELGVGARSYLEVGQWQTSVCSSFSASASFRSELGNTSQVNAFISFKAKGLERRSADMSAMIAETIQDVRFDETSRIKEIVGQMLAGRERSLTGNGHSVAVDTAGHLLSLEGQVGYRIGGLGFLTFLKTLVKDIENAEKLQALSKELAEIHALVKGAPKQSVVVAEEAKMDAISKELAQSLGSVEGSASFKPFAASKAEGITKQMWVVNTQVNFCAKAYAAVPSTHADAPALHVLASYLRDNFLHTAIREKGGAYGGGARFNSNQGVFGFYSYRDPRIAGTLADYDAAVEWVKTHTHDETKVREAIFGVISGIDSPETPMVEAAGHFSEQLHGRSDAFRADYRARLLKVTAADLVRVANTYLNPQKAHVAVIASEASLKKEGDLGLEVKRLPA